MKKISDKYLALWAEQHEREAKWRPLSADEESFLALVREAQASRAELAKLREENRAMGTERDAYRSMLADLMAVQSRVGEIGNYLWIEVRELLKNGPAIKEQP